MTAPTYTDNRGKTHTVEIGMKYDAGYGRMITVEGYGTWDQDPMDGRYGSPIVYGPMSQDGEEAYPGWEHADSLQYAIPTMAQMIAKGKK